MLAAALLALAGAASAAEPDPRIAEEIETTLLRLAELGALDALEDGRPLTIQREARLRYELGAVVEIGPRLAHAEVVAITPGGSAARMGLAVGDRIVAINGVALGGDGDPGATFARAVMESGGRFTLAVRRRGRALELVGSAEPVQVPGFRLRIEQPLATGREPATTPP
jgi:predicted metalloprotease with PDZ domain